jgi:hypothetical protein
MSVTSPRGAQGKNINTKSTVISSILSGTKEITIDENLGTDNDAAIIKKQEEIFLMKDKIFKARFDKTLPDTDIKQNLTVTISSKLTTPSYFLLNYATWNKS